MALSINAFIKTSDRERKFKLRDVILKHGDDNNVSLKMSLKGRFAIYFSTDPYSITMMEKFLNQFYLNLHGLLTEELIEKILIDVDVLEQVSILYSKLKNEVEIFSKPNLLMLFVIFDFSSEACSQIGYTGVKLAEAVKEGFDEFLENVLKVDTKLHDLSGFYLKVAKNGLKATISKKTITFKQLLNSRFKGDFIISKRGLYFIHGMSKMLGMNQRDSILTFYRNYCIQIVKNIFDAVTRQNVGTQLFLPLYSYKGFPRIILERNRLEFELSLSDEVFFKFISRMMNEALNAKDFCSMTVDADDLSMIVHSYTKERKGCKKKRIKV